MCCLATNGTNGVSFWTLPLKNLHVHHYPSYNASIQDKFWQGGLRVFDPLTKFLRNPDSRRKFGFGYKLRVNMVNKRFSI